MMQPGGGPPAAQQPAAQPPVGTALRPQSGLRREGFLGLSRPSFLRSHQGAGGPPPLQPQPPAAPPPQPSQQQQQQTEQAPYMPTIPGTAGAMMNRANGLPLHPRREAAPGAAPPQLPPAPLGGLAAMTTNAAAAAAASAAANAIPTYAQSGTGALTALMPGRHGTPGMAPGTVLEHPVVLRAGAATYVVEKVVGNGSFGVVLQARVEGGGAGGENVAIKRVLQDKRYKNRELQIMRMFHHPNIVELKNSFYSSGGGNREDEVFLHLVLEFVPETVYKVCRDFIKRKQSVPVHLIKLFMFQLFRALAYMHSMGACHRDIKPQNLLVDMSRGTLKLCDFGSAKVLQRGEANVSYICSRYYRAPELIFGASNYTTAIDVWSSGCVMAEMFLGQPLFPGDSGVDQLVEIIKVLGTPTYEQVMAMNRDYPSYNFPDIKPHPWQRIFRAAPHLPPDALDFLSKVLVYTPNRRPTAIELCAHPFFEHLQDGTARCPNGSPLPGNLFEFTPEEMSAAAQYNVRERLDSMRTAFLASGGGGSSASIFSASGSASTWAHGQPSRSQQQQPSVQLPHISPHDHEMILS